MNEILAEHEVTTQRIQQLFESAFLPIDVDEDGDLVVRDEGINTFVMLDEDKKLISFFTMWRFREGVSEADRTAFCNELNDDLILVRFSTRAIPRPRLICDYQFLYEGGILPHQVIYAYRTFHRVCAGAMRRDKDDLIDGD